MPWFPRRRVERLVDDFLALPDAERADLYARWDRLRAERLTERFVALTPEEQDEALHRAAPMCEVCGSAPQQHPYGRACGPTCASVMGR